MKNATWSGRFKKSLDKEVLEFSESVSVDHLLFDSDIKVCMAHAQMLCECKIIMKSESNKICKGLQTIQKKYNDGKLSLSIHLEDVHMNIEQALTKEVGDLGKKIHMGRSRNDLVSTDLRLYLRDCVDLILKKIQDTRYAIAITALDNSNVVFPGYTHMQLAQPITFGHHLLAWHEMLQRDEQRLDNVREVILGEQDKLIRGQNWDKFYLENIISWWKRKAGKRYEKLKREGRFRTEVELWTEDDDIQIIR